MYDNHAPKYLSDKRISNTIPPQNMSYFDFASLPRSPLYIYFIKFQYSYFSWNKTFANEISI